MVEDIRQINHTFNEYFLKTFPDFQVVEECKRSYFHNLFAGFSVIPYHGSLTDGIRLDGFDVPEQNILPSISIVSLYMENESFYSCLINNSLLAKFVRNLSIKAENEKSSPVMRRADLSDLFSGRTLMATIANNCPNGFTLQNCPSGVQSIRGVLLDNKVDGAILGYLCEHKLI